MIVSVKSNQSSFKEVQFTSGFNVVLADRTRVSTRGDSRNGLGKTTLLEIIHFCMGANTSPNKGLRAPQLKGWTFTVEIQVEGKTLTVTRAVDKPSEVQLQGDFSDFGDVGEVHNGFRTARIDEWTTFLGQHLFGLQYDEQPPKHRPTFRSLFSYKVRRNGEAFLSPFTHHRRQNACDTQVNNAYLLDLAWKDASELQELRDQRRALGNLRSAAGSGLLNNTIGTPGNLEAERTRLGEEIQQRSLALQNFQVHPNYIDIERRANDLTAEMQRLANANISDGRLLDLYRSSTQDHGLASKALIFRSLLIQTGKVLRQTVYISYKY